MTKRGEKNGKMWEEEAGRQISLPVSLFSTLPTISHPVATLRAFAWISLANENSNGRDDRDAPIRVTRNAPVIIKA